MKYLIAVCSVIAISTALAGPSTGRGLNALDAALLRSVDEIAVSADGSKVAWTSTVPRDPLRDTNGPSFGELHVYDRERGVSRPFVTGEVSVSQVAWSRDGRYLAYRAQRGADAGPALYVIPADGGESRRVGPVPEGFVAYALGPEGRRVAFLATEPRSDAQQSLVDAGFDMVVHEESARPDRLFIVDVDLADPSQDGPAPRRIDLDGHVAGLQWARSGEHLLILRTPTSRIDDRYMRSQYAVVDARTGTLVGGIETRGKLGEAQLSRDGSRVALIGPDSPNDPAAGRLMVVPATGGVPRTLLGREFAGSVRAVRWSSEHELIFLADEGVHSFVGRIDAAGGEVQRVVEGPRPVVTAIDLSADGRVLAARGDTPQHPSELFVGRTGGALERVTDSNPWLAGVELAPQRVIEWEARDGLTLEGILIGPLTTSDSGEPWPLIVSVHGGPESHERDDWKTTAARVGQCAAAEGFAVFYPNYRGSTGRGVEFSELSQGDPGGREFDDVIDGLDYLISTGLVDPARVAVTGRSYGGFATAWCATRFSERFAAAVMSAGVSEQVSKFGTTDIPYESQQVHQYPRKVYEDWDFFRDRSPIFHAAGSTTPLLIMHGAADTRVHPTQSLTMYRYFQEMAEAPVRLVLYPAEPHSNRKAAGRFDYRVRMLRWMRHFLLEGGTELPDLEIDYRAEVARLRAESAAPGR